MVAYLAFWCDLLLYLVLQLLCQCVAPVTCPALLPGPVWLQTSVLAHCGLRVHIKPVWLWHTVLMPGATLWPLAGHMKGTMAGASSYKDLTDIKTLNQLTTGSYVWQSMF